jgi:predicted site-specific integrase-resolvase
MNTYNVREFAQLIGVSVKTLQRWDREGRLVAGRTITNRRVYTDKDLAKALGRVRIPEDNREVVAYLRVSQRAQKTDMANQRAALEAYCLEHGHNVTLWLEDYGSGLSFKRRNLRKLITMIITDRVRLVIVAHKDRLGQVWL